ncbi:MAG: ParA family protein, partial [Parcubacteria group bacterium]
GFSVVPSTFDLAGAEQYFAQRQNRDRDVLKRGLRPFRDAFDFIILDCPPSLGQIVVAAVTAADAAIVPMTAGLYEIGSLAQVEKVLDARGTPLLGIVLGRIDTRLGISAEVVEWARSSGRPVFETIIPERVALRYATTAQEPITEYSPHSDIAEAFRRLAGEVVATCHDAN